MVTKWVHDSHVSDELFVDNANRAFKQYVLLEDHLLNQAIRFAEYVAQECDRRSDLWHEAQAFLARPEVQARRKKDLPIQCDWDGTGFY